MSNNGRQTNDKFGKRETMGNPNWVKGVSGNPAGGGRPKSKLRQAFEDAVKEVEAEKQKTFFKHCVECAWTEPSLMRDVLRKLVPDLKMIEGELKMPEGLKIIIERPKSEGKENPS